MRIILSAPIERGFFITSITNSLPTDNTVTVPPPAASLICNAASTAFSQKPFTTGGMPCTGVTCLISESTLNADEGVSGSITCLAHTIIFMDIANRSSVPGKLTYDFGHI